MLQPDAVVKVQITYNRPFCGGRHILLKVDLWGKNSDLQLNYGPKWDRIFTLFTFPITSCQKIKSLDITDSFQSKEEVKSNERFIEGNLLLKVANMSSNNNSNVNNILVVNEIYFLGGKSNNISSGLKNISTCWVIFWGEMYSISSFIGNIFNDNG